MDAVMANAPRNASLGLVFLLIGFALSFLMGVACVGVGLYGSGLLGGTPLFEPWIGWSLIALGAVSWIGGEVGLRAYRSGREGDLRSARAKGFVAALLPPVQLAPLIGALLCRPQDSAPTSPSTENRPFSP